MNLREVRIDQLFDVVSGDYHAVKELDEGKIPLMSCGDDNAGLVGYYDIPKEKRYEHAITVAYNGSPLTSKYHPYPFGAKDDVAVLKPKVPVPEAFLLYVAAVLNRMRWRYSYGRKCFREKLKAVFIPVPVGNAQGPILLDEKFLAKVVADAIAKTKAQEQVIGDVFTRIAKPGKKRATTSTRAR